MKTDFLRKKYPKFIYQKYYYKISGVKPRGGHATLRGNNLEIFFDFQIEPDGSTISPQAIFFRPEIIIKNINKSQIKRIGEKILNNLIFHLGLIEILSYWKATCSPKIEVRAGHLNRDQIKWWKDLIFKGMGQFFYENKIDFRKPNFLDIACPKSLDIACPTWVANFSNKDKVLVPIGGGKDSVVTLEILKKAKKNIRCFSLNPILPAQKIMRLFGARCPIIVQRKIDPKLLELNRKGFLNGHTPFSAYLAFLSVLIAGLFDYKYIAFSNERSSNEGNLKYLGKVINHQYSKSFDFEQKLRNYSKNYLTKGIEYFSFLRPLYEIQIAKLFSKYSKYFPIFLSCNKAFKTYSGLRPTHRPPAKSGPLKKPTGKWCGNCPKCLFIFASLYPFVEEKKLLRIFGQNLFKKKELLPIMLELMGERKFKPFECVGTKKESLVAFYLALRSFQRRRVHGKPAVQFPLLLRYFEDKILNSSPRRISSISERFLRGWNNQHNLSKNFEKILRKVLI